MSELSEADKRLRASSARHALEPRAWKYPLPSKWGIPIGARIAVVVSAIFYAVLLFGLGRCVGQVMAQPAGQPSVQNPFDPRIPQPPRPAPERPRRAPAGPSDTEIAERLIAESIAGYDGPCACPYQHDRAGRSCGRRSAYNRPRGATPLCFEKDVTPDMLADARARR